MGIAGGGSGHSSPLFRRGRAGIVHSGLHGILVGFRGVAQKPREAEVLEGFAKEDCPSGRIAGQER